MLTESQKRIISKVLEDCSELKSITLSLGKRMADIFVSVMPDEETNKVRELDDFAFHLSGISKIVISSHKENLPKEIEGVKTPSPEFILFATSLFEQQGIYEWNCFEDPLKRFKDEWKATWTYEFQPITETPRECILFFKERQKSVWVIGLWFSKLVIEDGAISLGGSCEEDFITVEEFAGRYRKRLGENP